MKKPRLPKVGEFVRHHGRLVKIQEIPPPPPPKPKKDDIFEEIEARCDLLLNGELIKYLFTYNDFYGLETSVKTAIDDAQKYATEKGIGPKSDVEVVVYKITSLVRKRPKNGGVNFYDKRFVDFDWLEYDRHQDLPGPVETVVWRSGQHGPQ